jgi:hypothetical protein
MTWPPQKNAPKMASFTPVLSPALSSAPARSQRRRSGPCRASSQAAGEVSTGRRCVSAALLALPALLAARPALALLPDDEDEECVPAAGRGSHPLPSQLPHCLPAPPSGRCVDRLSHSPPRLLAKAKAGRQAKLVAEKTSAKAFVASEGYSSPADTGAHQHSQHSQHTPPAPPPPWHRGWRARAGPPLPSC